MFADGLLEPVVDPFREDLWDGVDAANNQAEFRVSAFVDFKGAVELWNASCRKVQRLGCALKVGAFSVGRQQCVLVAFVDSQNIYLLFHQRCFGIL